ncbi:zinc-dependent metalloprotease [Gracilimonas sediminicola]|uniref:T9SS type A sorting domain-containing protein n=1 Tax=Gracilimonas sediminicola TaxID=2952158 RepID=A0A9X2L2T5_9BACT|nr:zinc-dependent metalloprotease [Gracilimonas sediminicola]MCP9291270.1 T9SS type A sorting domain-containing protein [Gracilimonas sediminicola]
MKIKIIVLSLVGICLASTSATAQKKFLLNEVLPSFAKVNPENPNRTFYSLNNEVFSNPEFKKGADFFFETGEGSREFTVTRRMEYLPGYISIIAAEKGETERVLSFTYHQGRLNGIYHKSHDSALSLRYDEDSAQNYMSKKKKSAGELLACGVHESKRSLITPPRKFGSDKANYTKARKGSEPTLLYGSADDSVTIDVMLVYTNAAETWAATSSSGDINATMAQAMTLSQTALDNSKAGINLRLVHTYKTNYDEENDGVESEDRLRRLSQNPDNPQFEAEYDGYMEDVHDLRNQYGADVVSLIAKIDDTGGLGWRLGSSGGEEAYAFNLNRVQQIANGYTLIHEIGHNMGNAHSRTQNSSSATDAGGLYHYSVGYQNQSSDFHTVMAYADGLSEAPIFSSPDLTWQGVPTGTNNVQTPEDNARSMKEIKWSVASYRLSVVDAPVAAVSANEIEVEMNREDEFTATIDISNSGNSALMWSADFDFTSQTVEKQTQREGEEIKPVFLESPLQNPANYSGFMNPLKTALAEEVIYNTSFESNEGFSSGSYKGRAGWRALSDSEFKISGENPNTGTQHLRLEYDGSGNTQFIASPFFGYQLFGEYEISIRFLVSNTSETYDFYIFDGKTGGFSSGVIIANQTMFAADENESGQVSFFGTGASVSPNVYGELRIVYNNSNETIDYYYNGNLISQNSFLEGFTPGLIQVLHRNQVSGTYMDIDNIEIKQSGAPYEWLSVPSMSGVSLEGRASQLELTFNTEGIDSGTYETLLKVTTNDPENPEFEIPVTLTVNEMVSNEPGEIPEQVNLHQNYPNPFNPSTAIRFNVSEPGNVKLTVYNMQGQKVATLLNQKKNRGEHEVIFNADRLSSGVYIYRLQTGSQLLTRKMVLLK